MPSEVNERECIQIDVLLHAEGYEKAEEQRVRLL